jgi:hypothetical protein
VVNFGDQLPQREYELAEGHAGDCDLMLALGSSLQVQPAASLVGLALRGGARIVLVNRGRRDTLRSGGDAAGMDGHRRGDPGRAGAGARGAFEQDMNAPPGLPPLAK